jgi:hypothetical protein
LLGIGDLPHVRHVRELLLGELNEGISRSVGWRKWLDFRFTILDIVANPGVTLLEFLSRDFPIHPQGKQISSAVLHLF